MVKSIRMFVLGSGNNHRDRSVPNGQSNFSSWTLGRCPRPIVTTRHTFCWALSDAPLELPRFMNRHAVNSSHLFVATQGDSHRLASAASLLAEEAQPGGLNFLVLGDWGRNGEERPAGCRQSNGQGCSLTAQNLSSRRDNFYNDGVTSWTIRNGRVRLRKFIPIIVAGALACRARAITITIMTDAQIAYGKTTSAGACRRVITTVPSVSIAPRWIFLHRYMPMTVFDDDETSTTTKSRGMSYQTNGWFESALAASTAPWKMLSAIIRLFGGVHVITPYLVQHVLPLLEKYHVQAYLNGTITTPASAGGRGEFILLWRRFQTAQTQGHRPYEVCARVLWLHVHDLQPKS